MRESAGRNEAQAATGGVALLLSPGARKALQEGPLILREDPHR